MFYIINLYVLFYQADTVFKKIIILYSTFQNVTMYT